MDCIVCGVAKSQTWLIVFHSLTIWFHIPGYHTVFLLICQPYLTPCLTHACFSPGVMSVLPKRPFISLLSFKKRERRISDSCSPLNWLLVSGCSFHLNAGWHYLPIFSFFNHMPPLTSSKGGWRWLPHPADSHSLFLPWPPPHTVIYRSHASAFWNSGLTMNSGAIQLLPREHLVRLFPVAHFSVASFSFQWLNRSSNTSHGKYNSEVPENTVQQCFLMSFVHIFLDLIVSSFPFHPRRVTNSFPFSLLPPCKYLETLLISRLSHPLAQSCLWFLLPLLINRTPCTLIARNMPSPGKRRWEQQSLRWVTWGSLEVDLESGADETSALWSPTYSGPFQDAYYLICTCHFVLFF